MRLFILLALIALTQACGKDEDNSPAPVTEEEEEVVLKKTMFLDEDNIVNEDVCITFEINKDDECYISYVRLDIYTDDSRVLEVKYHHVKPDGTGSEGTTFNATSNSSESDEDMIVLVDENFAALDSEGVLVWARYRPDADTKTISLYHDDDDSGSFNEDLDQVILSGQRLD